MKSYLLNTNPGYDFSTATLDKGSFDTNVIQIVASMVTSLNIVSYPDGLQSLSLGLIWDTSLRM